MLNHVTGTADTKKAPRCLHRGALSENCGVLDDDDVFCLRAFLALCDVELNFLAFDQSLEA